MKVWQQKTKKVRGKVIKTLVAEGVSDYFSQMRLCATRRALLSDEHVERVEVHAEPRGDNGKYIEIKAMMPKEQFPSSRGDPKETYNSFFYSDPQQMCGHCNGGRRARARARGICPRGGQLNTEEE